MWNVAQVDGMIWMFFQASTFNQDMSKWDVDKVTNIQNMFSAVSTFSKRDLSKWNVDELTNMEMMFSGATSFKQVLCD